jgi:predicted nucleic acid-binding protein
MNKIALDTNVLIYNHGNDGDPKQVIADSLFDNVPIISTQVISEYLNVMKRISKMKKSDLLKMCAEWLEDCQIQSVSVSTIKLAHHIVQKYDFQLFDSIIVASALEAGCDILYSEDMQHNQVIEDTLTILNPFVSMEEQ